MNIDQNKLIDGKTLSQEILTNLTTQIAAITDSPSPVLAVILVGNNPASQVYVKNKQNACSKVGIKSVQHCLSENTSEAELLNLIQKLNLDPDIDAILVQLPLPKQIKSKTIIDNILPNKDVDGFHRYNMGSLALNNSQICPCTPHGIMYLLDKLKVNYHGLNVVVIGTSNIVGRPMALELLNRGATVTICNSKTKNITAITKGADVLIVAVGIPKLVKEDWVKPQSIIIDVGMNRLDDGSLCGDVDFNQVIHKVSNITPVPGGVGPMTIAMLIKNTLYCYQLNQKIKKGYL